MTAQTVTTPRYTLFIPTKNGQMVSGQTGETKPDLEIMRRA